MKHRQWKTTRQFLERPDAQRRWDQAYQFLVQWTSAPLSSPVPEGTQTNQEEFDEKSRVCSRLDPAAGTSANH